MTTEPPELAPETRRALIEQRVAHVRALVTGRGAPEAVLSERRNVAWITAGAATHVDRTTDEAVAAVRVTPSGWSVETSVIEERRLKDEELAGLDARVHVRPWEADLAPARGALRDADLERHLRVLRARLAPIEQERLRWLGPHAERALRSVADIVKPGDTEVHVAAAVEHHLLLEGIAAPVMLVAADERIAKYRHPLPTAARLARTLMLVAVAERWGLHVALTRLLSFGRPGIEVESRFNAARSIERVMHAATRAGRTLGDVIIDAVAEYRRTRFTDEWRLHHQGGTIGYRSREVIATPNGYLVIEPETAFAWNPSVTGAKVEDTFILHEDGSREVVTRTGAWPAGDDGAPAILLR